MLYGNDTVTLRPLLHYFTTPLLHSQCAHHCSVALHWRNALEGEAELSTHVRDVKSKERGMRMMREVCECVREASEGVSEPSE